MSYLLFQTLLVVAHDLSGPPNPDGHIIRDGHRSLFKIRIHGHNIDVVVVSKVSQLGPEMTIPKLAAGFAVRKRHQLSRHVRGTQSNDFVGLEK